MNIFKVVTLFVVLFSCSYPAFGQFGEPEVETKEHPRNLFDEGYKTGFGFEIALSDYGVGAGGQFRFGLSKYTEAILTLKAKGLKDPTEQTFINYTFGFKTVPEKYRRVFAVPLYVGIKQRFFAKEISDNFRVYSSLSAGPTFAISYAYFNDLSANGFRENDASIYGFAERVNDIFSGWDNSKTHWGMGGEFVVGIDFGENFANLSSVQFGYSMNYFTEGIQVMEPCRPDFSRPGQAPLNPCGIGPDYVEVGQNATPVPIEKSNDPRKYFGTAQISLIFGWMW